MNGQESYMLGTRSVPCPLSHLESFESLRRQLPISLSFRYCAKEYTYLISPECVLSFPRTSSITVGLSSTFAKARRTAARRGRSGVFFSNECRDGSIRFWGSIAAIRSSEWRVIGASREAAYGGDRRARRFETCRERLVGVVCNGHLLNC